MGKPVAVGGVVSTVTPFVPANLARPAPLVARTFTMYIVPEVSERLLLVAEVAVPTLVYGWMFAPPEI